MKIAANDKIVVTGAAGFIGSNIIAGLNARGYTNILAVDDLPWATSFAIWLICRLPTTSMPMIFT